jgi:hypothetical protein
VLKTWRGGQGDIKRFLHGDIEDDGNGCHGCVEWDSGKTCTPCYGFVPLFSDLDGFNGEFFKRRSVV